MALGLSEAGLTELLKTSHLLSFVLVLAVIGAIRVVKASFRLLRTGVEEVFEFLNFSVTDFYQFLGDVVEARGSYQQRRQAAEQKAGHNALSQASAKSPLPT